jgi:hypothetical protein
MKTTRIFGLSRLETMIHLAYPVDLKRGFAISLMRKAFFLMSHLKFHGQVQQSALDRDAAGASPQSGARHVTPMTSMPLFKLESVKVFGKIHYEKQYASYAVVVSKQQILMSTDQIKAQQFELIFAASN